MNQYQTAFGKLVGNLWRAALAGATTGLVVFVAGGDGRELIAAFATPAVALLSVAYGVDGRDFGPIIRRRR